MSEKYILIFASLFPTFLLAVKGEVIYEQGDYHVVDTGRGCSVLEWYGGSIASKGDKLVGDLDSYGLKDVYNISSKQKIRVYVEDYLLDEDDAIEIVEELVE